MPLWFTYGQSDYSITNEIGIGIHPDDKSWAIFVLGQEYFTKYYTALTSFSPSPPVTGVIGDPLCSGVMFSKKVLIYAQRGCAIELLGRNGLLSTTVVSRNRRLSQPDSRARETVA